jgi:hypothetical protein
MSNVVDVNLDKDEIELKIENPAGIQKIQYGKIVRLKFSQQLMRKWFRMQSIRTIEIHVRGREIPFIISSERVKAFDQMEPYLRQMAEKHNVSIEN